ncbi:hypothetical protein MKW94_025524 [Papaver nudicaule]|uniref:NPF family transporter n=1 Tax=Papaver nudicaule TaxID=74823 RepID=A0AA41V394_PAPNU|nr:hypothetical protein [Papaver nudicaule]
MAVSSYSLDGNGELEIEEPLLITTTTCSTSSSSSSSDDNGGNRNIGIGDAVDGVVDYKGDKVFDRSKYGGWKSAYFIIGIDIADSFTYWGISSNLISFLTGSLSQSTVKAAVNINVWNGAMSMLPLLGAFVADSYLGRFRTILFSSVIYILGLGLLTLSVMLPFDHITSGSPSAFQVIFFFFSLYLMGTARAGCKSSAQAFGADQFEGGDPKECKSKSSFFNWWFFGLCFGSSFSHLTLNYIQDNMGWSLGFGIPCIVMAAAIVVFLLRTKSYRYTVNEEKQNPLIRIIRVFIAAAKNWRKFSSPNTIQEEYKHLGANNFKFLDKALINNYNSSSRVNSLPCTVSQVDEAKAVVKLVPIWVTCLIYAIVNAQSSTFGVKQGKTMDRKIGADFQIPSASIQIFESVSIVIFVAIYDRVFVPLARTITGNRNGITMLQRIGCGIFLSTATMLVAATVEKRRLQTALKFGLIDMPQVTVPMSVWWLAPQYVLFGIADVFTIVGMQEFFYDQVPNELRAVGLCLFSSIIGTGHLLSGFLISTIHYLTSRSGHYSWFSDNLNRAHVDYFYWLLAGFSAFELATFIYMSNSYVYKTVKGELQMQQGHLIEPVD